ncbi:DUF4352 domain-containing protein [Haloplanus salinus]|jgi:hypothetical protein|uniref:DUF4352 domain-containing protein n=1 Tax=Haloplanus salinus TaxID=1126245 RepID=A0A368NBB3_9EURY|nr:DUF4352 domain-containing protein [Haloplanus salinus]RCU47410.1 DUF4352 domain-containing protein [Haloplanus salinus]
MERRKMLTACGTVFTGLLAGCSGGGGEDGDGDGDATPTATATTEPTATETDAPTATATEAPEPTETPASGGPTHGLDERFTVGSGENAIDYRIIDFYRTDRIGSSANNRTADGTYLLILLEFYNPQNDATTFPRNQFIVGNEEQIRYVDEDATPLVSDDDRIDTDPLLNATVLAGSSKVGAVVFDLDPDRSYRIRFLPTGGEGETHYLDIGTISDIQPLESSIVG